MLRPPYAGPWEGILEERPSSPFVVCIIRKGGGNVAFDWRGRESLANQVTLIKWESSCLLPNTFVIAQSAA